MLPNIPKGTPNVLQKIFCLIASWHEMAIPMYKNIRGHRVWWTKLCSDLMSVFFCLVSVLEIVSIIYVLVCCLGACDAVVTKIFAVLVHMSINLT